MDEAWKVLHPERSMSERTIACFIDASFTLNDGWNGVGGKSLNPALKDTKPAVGVQQRACDFSKTIEMNRLRGSWQGA
jgi:hypothetical protein